MSVQEIKVIVDYKTKEAHNKLQEASRILEKVKEDGDKEKISVWNNICDYRLAKWGAYNDIKETIELMQ